VLPVCVALPAFCCARSLRFAAPTGNNSNVSVGVRLVAGTGVSLWLLPVVQMPPVQVSGGVLVELRLEVELAVQLAWILDVLLIPPLWLTPDSLKVWFIGGASVNVSVGVRVAVTLILPTPPLFPERV